MTWVGATGVQIARAVRRGDTSAGEVVDEHLAHIERTDRDIGAFRVLRRVEALAEAAAIEDLPDLSGLRLAGVPVAVKENLAVAGERLQYGSAATLGPVAEADHEIVRRLRGAGAVVVGTTRMPELGLFAVTDDEDVVTRSPWRLERTAGGSSGGSAAAVASGAVPIAIGNDGLGSIRIPAACCGVVGLKPGRDELPAGIGTTDWLGLAQNGVLATNIADTVIGYGVLTGRGPQALPEPTGLTIAVSTRSPAVGTSADRDNRDAVARAVRHLVAAGHTARNADPGYPAWLGPVGIAHWLAAAHLEAEPFERAALQRRTRRHIAIGRRVAARGLARERDRDRWREHCRRWFAGTGDTTGYDVLVTPALATAPPLARHWSRRGWLANVLTSIRYAPYAAPWNIAGFPALVVPAGTRRDGTPAAVQLVGPPGTETLLLAVAAQLEVAAPWPRFSGL